MPLLQKYCFASVFRNLQLPITIRHHPLVSGLLCSLKSPDGVLIAISPSGFGRSSTITFISLGSTRKHITMREEESWDHPGRGIVPNPSLWGMLSRSAELLVNIFSLHVDSDTLDRIKCMCERPHNSKKLRKSRYHLLCQTLQLSGGLDDTSIFCFCKRSICKRMLSSSFVLLARLRP